MIADSVLDTVSWPPPGSAAVSLRAPVCLSLSVSLCLSLSVSLSLTNTPSDMHRSDADDELV